MPIEYRQPILICSEGRGRGYPLMTEMQIPFIPSLCGKIFPMALLVGNIAKEDYICISVKLGSSDSYISKSIMKSLR